jgi:hypothetical protein
MAQGGGGDLLEVGGSLFHGRLRRQLGFAEYTPWGRRLAREGDFIGADLLLFTVSARPKKAQSFSISAKGLPMP